MGEKTMSITIPKHIYLDVAQKFHWAAKEHFILWLTGELKRHRRTETMLPRLVRKGKLMAQNWGRKIVYTVPRRKNNRDVEHGLACTEGLVRFWLAKNGLVYPEHKFRGNGVVPEWGIKYDGKVILYEHCTYDNFKRGEAQKKITMYQNNLANIENQVNAEAMVVFVVDVDRWTLQHWVDERLPIGPQYFFTDYDNFLKSPYGDQLIEPIYIWGEDGWPYTLEG
jgi:hypothetical protein